jgi:transcriptional regulator with XRE-family HTH domain
MSNLPDHPLAGVRDRRELLGLSAAQCGSVVGVTANSFGRYERGERPLYLVKGLILAKFLGCTVEQLSTGPTIDERIEALHRQKAALEASQPTPATPAPQPRSDGLDFDNSPEATARLINEWNDDDDS